VRNNYLKKHSEATCDSIYLETINEQLIENGMKVMMKRMAFVEDLNGIIEGIHHEISEEKEVLKIQYVSPIIKQKIRDYDKMKEVYKGLLDSKLSVDLKNNYTAIGPHRDEINIFINDKDLKIYGSQGQIRTATLSLVIGVMKITHEVMGEKPLLLLDDVFSELDDDRKNKLLEYVKEYQTFITSTDLAGIDFDKISNFQIFDIEEGKIRRRSFQ
jgi:DNA replication and repair protein RecF